MPVEDRPHLPPGLESTPEGELLIQGTRIAGLAQRYGTPLHIVSADALVLSLNRLAAPFRDLFPRVRFFYSFKTFPAPGIVSFLHSLGMGVETVSCTELLAALKIVKEPERGLIFNNASREAEGLKMAIRGRPFLIVIDSEIDIPLLEGYGGDVAIRIAPSPLDQGWNWFGSSIKGGEAERTLKRAKDRGINVTGLHIHSHLTFRNLRTARRVLEAAGRFFTESRRRGIPLRILDIGGGLPSLRVRNFNTFQLFSHIFLHKTPPYRPALNPPSPGTLTATIHSALGATIPREIFDELTLVLEPGRAITGSSSLFVTEVLELIERRGRRFALLETGKASLSRPLLTESHRFLRVSPGGPKVERYDLVGRTCNPDDWCAWGVPLRELKKGDYIAVLDTGAYFLPQETNFSHPRPPVVLMAGSRPILIRRREGPEEVFSMDLGGNF